MNGSDCGMFACKYAEFASRGKTVFNFNQVNNPKYSNYRKKILHYESGRAVSIVKNFIPISTV